MRGARRFGEPDIATPKERVYIVGDGWDFAWAPKPIEKVSALYNAGWPVQVIAEAVDRSSWETMMLLVDLAERGLIKERAGYLWGKR